MYAGKTFSLLAEVAALQKEGRRVKIIKAKQDDRYSTTYVSSHTGQRALAHEVVHSLTEVITDNVDVLAIDELHLFKNAAEAVK